LYDGNGSRIDFTGAQAKEIKWKWYSYSVKLNTDNEDAGYMELLGSRIGST